METRIEEHELSPVNGRIIISSGFTATLWITPSEVFKF